MSETIGQYELLGLLGTGGSGTVHRARDTRAGRTVEVRVLGDVAGSAAARARFIEAVRPFTEISHPHVATLFDVGEHRGSPYLVYEFVPGERLTEVAAGRPLNLRRALDLCIQVADGLAEAHSFGLFHGALTPASIVVTPKGHVKVLDFGLSAWQPGGADPQMSLRPESRGNALGLGSVAYMAPEQVLGQPTDHRADCFALGVILYQLLTGRQPFEGASPADTGVRIAQHTPKPPSALSGDIPRELDAMVARALAKNVDDRYDSAATLAADLRVAASSVLQRETGSDLARTVTPAPSGRSVGRLLLLVILLIAAVAVAAWSLRDRAARAWDAYYGPSLEPIVAVTPFIVGGGDVSREYLGSGMADELATRLGHLRGVTVKGGSSIRALGGKPLVTVAAETGARLVVAGTVAPGPDGWATFDVTVELVGGTDGRAVWNGRYSGPAADMGAVQARIARDIGSRLKLPPAASAANDRASLRLVNPDAYDAYLQGRDARAGGDTGRAAQLFETAIAADPSLIEAQAALAEALYAGVMFDARIAYPEAHARMRQVSEESSSADPGLATAQMAMGLSAETFREALEHLRRALEIDPSFTSAYLAVADVLRDVDPVRAIRFARRATELDPLQPLTTYQEAVATLSMGQRAETLVIVARGQASAPTVAWWDAIRQRAGFIGPGSEPSVAATRSVSDFAPGALVRAGALVREGRYTDASSVLGIVTRMNPGFCEARALLAGVRLLEGKRAEAQRIAADIEGAARTATDGAPWVRCAAMAAAAVQDAESAAFWVGRAAADERALRLWGATSAVMSPVPAIRQKLFPWNNVVANTKFANAVAGLESALVRTRAEVAKTLNGVDRFEP